MTIEGKRRTARRQHRRVTRETFMAYTPTEESGRRMPKCAKCGEEDLDVLCLHHTHGNGKEDRAEYGYGRKYWDSLQARHYPPSLEVLCANCNIKARIKDPTIKDVSMV